MHANLILNCNYVCLVWIASIFVYFIVFLGSRLNYLYKSFFFRPALKGMVRQGNNFLQVCKQIGALTKIDNPDGDVTVLREAMGVLQVICFVLLNKLSWTSF